MGLRNKYFLILMLAFCLADKVFPQNRKLDSVKQIVSSLPEIGLLNKKDTLKIDALNYLIYYLIRAGEYDKALEEGIRSETFSVKLNYKKGISKALNLQGNIYTDRSNFPKGLDCYFKSLKILREINLKTETAAILNNIGNTYKSMNDFPKATKYHFESLKLKEEVRDTAGMGYSFNNIGLAYLDEGDHKTALDYFHKALIIFKNKKNISLVAGIYDNIGNAYGNLKEYDSCEIYHLKAIHILENIKDKNSLASCYCNLGYVYFLMEKYPEAINYCNKSLALSKEMEILELIADVEITLSDLYEKTGKHNLAYDHYAAYISARDSIFNEDNTKKAVQSEMNFEFEKKEALAKAAQDKKDAIAVEESRKKSIIIWSVISGLVIVIIFVCFLFNHFRLISKQKLIIESQKKVVEKQKELVEEKQKEILDSIKYAGRIQLSMMSSEKYVANALKKLIKE